MVESELCVRAGDAGFLIIGSRFALEFVGYYLAAGLRQQVAAGKGALGSAVFPRTHEIFLAGGGTATDDAAQQAAQSRACAAR